MKRPKTEKYIAIAVIVFNSITNLLMLLPITLFLILIIEGMVRGERIPLVAVGFMAIAYSYYFNIRFGSYWSSKSQESGLALNLWFMSAFHYLAFAGYLLWFMSAMSQRLRAVYFIIVLPIFIPLILSFIGIYINRIIYFSQNKSLSNKKDGNKGSAVANHFSYGKSKPINIQ